MPGPVLQGTVLIGPLAGVQPGQRLPAGGQAEGTSVIARGLDKGDFACLLPQTTEQEQPNTSTAIWMIPMHAVLTLNGAEVAGPTGSGTAAAVTGDGGMLTAGPAGRTTETVPDCRAIPSPDPDNAAADGAAADGAESLDLGRKELVGVALQGVVAGDDASRAMAETLLPPASNLWTPGTARQPESGPREVAGPALIAVPAFSPAELPSEPVEAREMAFDPQVGGPRPIAPPSRQSVVPTGTGGSIQTSDQEIRLLPSLPETDWHLSGAAPSRSDDAMARAQKNLVNELGPTFHQVGAPLQIDGTGLPRHQAQPSNALLMRFESDGQPVQFQPTVMPEAKAMNEHSRHQALQGGITPSALVIAQERLVQASRPFAKDQETVVDPIQPASNPAQTASVWGPPLSVDGPKSIPPDMSSLTRHLVDTLTKGPGGETTLTLSPEELGTVHLSFRPDHQNADRMVVTLGFDRPETMELFRRHTDQLADALRTAGYAGVEIGFGGAGDGNSRSPLDQPAPDAGKEDDLTLQDDAFPVPARGRTGTLGALDLRL